jgi:hypothetical protein
MDSRLQTATNNAGCFAQFYNGTYPNATSAKTVLLSDLSQLYLDNYIFSNITNKIFLIYSAEVTGSALNVVLDRVNSKINRLHTYGSFTGGNTTNKFVDGVYVPNNKCIYAIPFGSGFILKINTLTNEMTQIGTILTTTQYSTGILVGNFIYGMPYNATNVLKIDVRDDSFTTIGSLGAVTGKYANKPTLIGDRYIYELPNTAASILKIDTQNDAITLLGSLGATSNKYADQWLAPNGNIYATPSTATNVLKVDPSNDNITLLGNLSVSTIKWGCAMCSNGVIYGIPVSTTKNFLKIDTRNDQVSTFGDFVNTITALWHDATSRGNYVYGDAHNSSHYIKINGDNDIITQIGPQLGIDLQGATKIQNSILVGNDIWAIPWNVPLSDVRSVLNIDINDNIYRYGYFPLTYNTPWALSIADDHKNIWAIPHNGTNVLKITLR